MFGKIKNILGTISLNRIKSIASIITALSVFILAVVFLFFANYEYFDDKIKVIGEAKIEIPKIKSYNIEISALNNDLLNKKVEQFKTKLVNEFSDFDLKNTRDYEISKIYFINFTISFKNDSDNDRFKKFLKNNFKNDSTINWSFSSIKDNNFKIDNLVLLEMALEDAKKKAEKIAEKSNRKLGKIKNVDEDPPYISGFDDYNKKDFIMKRVELTYKLK